MKLPDIFNNNCLHILGILQHFTDSTFFTWPFPNYCSHKRAAMAWYQFRVAYCISFEGWAARGDKFYRGVKQARRLHEKKYSGVRVPRAVASFRADFGFWCCRLQSMSPVTLAF